MKKIFLPMVFVSVFFCSLISAGADELPKKFDPQRDPAKDLSIAVKTAGESGKNIIMDIGGNWCIWCRIMDKWIEENSDVKDYLHAHYILLKVNFSPENENEEFLSRFPKIQGYPHIFVLSHEGKLLHSQDTGLLEDGKSYDREKFLNFLKEWSPEK